MEQESLLSIGYLIEVECQSCEEQASVAADARGIDAIVEGIKQWVKAHQCAGEAG